MSHRPALVVHLAWSASGTPRYRSSLDNARWLESTLELADACRDVGAHFVCVGTVVDGSAAAVDRYSASKAQLRSRLASRIHAGSVTWIRPHYVFDPASDRPELVAQARAAARSGHAVALRWPTARHDFIHASDVGKAIAMVAPQQIGGVIEIGSGETHMVSDVVEKLGAAWLPTSPPPGPDPSTPPADIKVLRDDGWHPTYTEEFFRHGSQQS